MNTWLGLIDTRPSKPRNSRQSYHPDHVDVVRARSLRHEGLTNYKVALVIDKNVNIVKRWDEKGWLA